jgi:hypothetical protein
VTGTITAQVSGASKLTYTGTPQFTKRDALGGSSIQPGLEPAPVGVVEQGRHEP